MGKLFNNYEVGDFYDEMFAAPGVVRPHYHKVLDRFTELTDAEVAGLEAPYQQYGPSWY